ncbi:MAG: phospho-sugar mutase, partial [Leptospiraceae bacterium]|nr:phospho-sugar mutase [Leptospiraceae bacterium]
MSVTENEAIKTAILDWTAPGFPLEIREEAARIFHDYVQGQNQEEVDYYAHPLQFGTGGLRGVIGNGAGRMNRWTVGRTTVGLSQFLAKRSKKPALVIAHDSRRMSREFAETTAGVAAGLGLNVFLFQGVTPTPVLSFAIRELKATGGVVITASHNPPEYNGYKVYASDGSQMVGEDQTDLEASIAAVTDYASVRFLSPSDDLFQKRVKIIGDDIKKIYYEKFKGVPFVSSASARKKDIKIIYSPLHGTGGPWLPGLMQKYGFQVEMVPEQAEPDGEFPTVRFPNPEEREALKLSEELAREKGADLFLATDPDADRLGAGIRDKNGQYVLINGNQIGSLMCAFLCEKMGAGERKKSDPQWHVFKTIVTTDLQTRIAEQNGVRIHDVLTGFKYIAEQMRNIELSRAGFKKGRDLFLFGGEESYGYLPVEFVRDKDSLASALLLCEMIFEKGDILDYLNEVYLRYGLYLEDLKSVTMKGSAGQQKMTEIINRLREEDLTGWKLGERTVTGVLDYKKQTRNGKADREFFKDLPTSNVLQFLLEPEGKLTIRPSGTEPKVKLYVSLRHPVKPTSLDEL